MDAFYASVEQRDHPELRGKPIAVGGGSKRGVTTTASYEARAYGVRSAMPGWKAKELCPELIFVKPRFDVYYAVSKQIRKIFKRYTDLVEPLSLDEAYLDVTSNKLGNPIATEIAKMIRSDIFEDTQLTASAGVSYCKFLAKIASDYNKPDGQTVIKPHKAIPFIHKLPIRKFYGVGKVTAAKMEELGINIGYDLSLWTLDDLTRRFGKSGKYFYNIARGIDDRQVQPHRVRKSQAVERTLLENISGTQPILDFALDLTFKLIERIEKSNFYGRTLTLKLKNKDFVLKTRSYSAEVPFSSVEDLQKGVKWLVSHNEPLCKDIRLIGLSISNADEAGEEGGQLLLDL